MAILAKVINLTRDITIRKLINAGTLPRIISTAFEPKIWAGESAEASLFSGFLHAHGPAVKAGGKQIFMEEPGDPRGPKYQAGWTRKKNTASEGKESTLRTYNPKGQQFRLLRGGLTATTLASDLTPHMPRPCEARSWGAGTETGSASPSCMHDFCDCPGWGWVAQGRRVPAQKG